MSEQMARTIRITVGLPIKEHAMLEALAKSRDVSMSWIARRAIIQYLTANSDELQLDLRFTEINK